MIEQVIKDYLNNCGLEAPTYLEVPKDPPTRYYTVEKTGGSGKHIFYSTVAIQSHSDTLYTAADMMESLKKIMLFCFIELDYVTRVELNSDYNFTDTESKEYRYQAVFDIVHY